MSIGRAPDNTIVISDPSVALHHACIAEQGGRYVVRDLSNGQTHVSFRGDPTQERPTSTNALRDGSTIRFGQVKSVLRQPPGGAGPGAVARAGVWLEIPFALKAIVAIGRDPGNHIVVNSSQVALRQAEVRQEAGRWVICDVGGGGGVRVSFSGDPAQARPVQGRNALKTGSMFYVGDVAFELQA
jgi:pSer/pThr/pTyr-binding forkhead associated (FHA) protein